MRCPFCGFADTQVKDSRPTEDATAIRRRRSCPACGSRFTTFERVQLRELTVVKRDGTRQIFDRDKLLRSVSVAARKRPLGEEQLERLVSGIVRQLESTGETDIQSPGIHVLFGLDEDKINRALNDYLFEAQGFVGNRQNYYDPRNSFLKQVLDRRTGIPITLSLVYLELAKRVDFPMAGVGMPGHFLVRPTLEDMAIFVDAFHKGEVMFEEDCRDRIQMMYGKGARMRPQHLEPIGPRPFLVRMLTNLKVIYLQQQDISRALAAIDRILLLTPDAVIERRDRGLIYYREGRLGDARNDLKFYLRSHPDAQDSFEIQQVLSQINDTLRGDR